eukprot:TRINITY_DN40042_c0_g1_i1.p1 TRINITY_DN40042_c0_g1~~TRINITY_DN40042_c0_g1_i1.p1  ORF type:complete len:447 (+),score=60.06 TRINITY_DN40042_c0_g1_i1:79-1419(+)
MASSAFATGFGWDSALAHVCPFLESQLVQFGRLRAVDKHLREKTPFWKQVQAQMACQEDRAACTAIRAVAKMALRHSGSDVMLTSLVEILGCGRRELEQEAAIALKNLYTAGSNDDNVFGMIMEKVHGDDPAVRAAALRAVPLVVGTGEFGAIFCVFEMSLDKDVGVRTQAAVSALEMAAADNSKSCALGSYAILRGLERETSRAAQQMMMAALRRAAASERLATALVEGIASNLDVLAHGNKAEGFLLAVVSALACFVDISSILDQMIGRLLLLMFVDGGLTDAAVGGLVRLFGKVSHAWSDDFGHKMLLVFLEKFRVSNQPELAVATLNALVSHSQCGRGEHDEASTRAMIALLTTPGIDRGVKLSAIAVIEAAAANNCEFPEEVEDALHRAFRNASPDRELQSRLVDALTAVDPSPDTEPRIGHGERGDLGWVYPDGRFRQFY